MYYLPKLLKINSEEINKICDAFELVIIDEGYSEPSPEWGELFAGLMQKNNSDCHTIPKNLFIFDVDTEHSYIYI